MLVLSRYKDQSIYIGDDIVVTIVDVRGDRIRLGVEAPPNVPVHRQEIYEQIQREKFSQNDADSRASYTRNDRVELDREGFSEEIRTVRSRYAGATAVVMGGWVSEAVARRLEKTLNLHLEWRRVCCSEEELQDYIRRPDVRLFIVQEPWCDGSGRFERAVLASGKDFVPYPHSILTADKIAKAICKHTSAPEPFAPDYFPSSPLRGRARRPADAFSSRDYRADDRLEGNADRELCVNRDEVGLK